MCRLGSLSVLISHFSLLSRSSTMKSFPFGSRKKQVLPIQTSLLTIPLKITKDLDLKAALESWTEKSHPHLNAIHVPNDIKRLHSLHSDIRNTLHTPTAHELALSDSILDTLVEYHACLLAAIQRGYPSDGSNAHVNGSIDANLIFWWKHAFCDEDGHDEDTLSIKTQAHLNYERCGVLWNIAACHMCLAKECDWSEKEGRTEAHRSYLLAARIFRHILTLKTKIKMADSSVTPDLKASSLEMCLKICQAQGQMIAYEALKEKLTTTDNKDNDSIFNLLSKVSAGVSDFFDAALKLSQNLAIRNQPSSVKIGRHVKAQSMLFRARSEFLVSQVEHVNSKFGVELARLAIAEEMAKEGVNFAKGSGVMPGVKGSIETLLKTIQSKIKTATEENNTIYHERIPKTRTLSQLKGNDVMSLGEEVDTGCENGQDFPEEFRPESLTRPMFVDAPKL